MFGLTSPGPVHTDISLVTLVAGAAAATHMPAPLECSVYGVLAVGDVRSGSVKRVGAAIGEGAAVVAQIHALLAAVPVPH